MSDLSPLGLSRTHEDEWREFFRTGRVYTAPVDRQRLQHRMSVNTTVLIVTGLVVVLVAIGAIVATITDFGRIATYILLILLIVAAGFVFLKFWFTRRRLRAGLASTDDYLVVSAEGIRFAGHVDLPWTIVFGGIGTDMRGLSGSRPAARISRAAGVAEAEFVLGVHGIRAIRDAAPKALHGVFEVMAHHGGIRIPLDNVVAPEFVRASLAAISVSGHLAGVRADVSTERDVVFKATMAVLGEPEKFESAMP